MTKDWKPASDCHSMPALRICLLLVVTRPFTAAPSRSSGARKSFDPHSSGTHGHTRHPARRPASGVCRPRRSSDAALVRHDEAAHPRRDRHSAAERPSRRPDRGALRRRQPAVPGARRGHSPAPLDAQVSDGSRRVRHRGPSDQVAVERDVLEPAPIVALVVFALVLIRSARQKEQLRRSPGIHSGRWRLPRRRLGATIRKSAAAGSERRQRPRCRAAARHTGIHQPRYAPASIGSQRVKQAPP